MRDDYFARTARKREERRAQTPALPQNLACFRAFALSRVRRCAGAMAGFQLAAMNIPQVLGYTGIAGTPIATGFYTLLLPLVGFAAFGSSRY
jgi:MFS superfamily sulfate permease-like transporter